MKVRAASEKDVSAVTAIYAHAVLHGTASYEIEPPDESEMRRRFDVLADGGFPFLVAVEGAEVRAYAYAGPFRTRPAYRWTVEDSVYVSPDAQGRGACSAFVRWGPEKADRDGALTERSQSYEDEN